jgi:hypothetical protein
MLPAVHFPEHSQRRREHIESMIDACRRTEDSGYDIV